MTHPVDIHYPYDATLPKPLTIRRLEDLRTVEDRVTAAASYDLHQALEAKRQGKRVSRDGYTFDNETDGKQHAAGDR